MFHEVKFKIMSKIKKLPQNLVNLIAAGEVVERPASALKEILENAIDAKSTKIVVRIENAGNQLIQVEDNGVGMDQADALMAFEQHATSKISTEEDLNKIYTLGFRGEALASISSVCQKLNIETKQENGQATKVTNSNGSLTQEESAKTSTGTILSVYGLFENIPARKKFLKNEATEFKHIAQTFINTAIPNLDIHFELWHNNKEIYKLTKVTNFKDRIFEIWGNTISKHIFEPVEYNSTGLKVTAFLGSTEVGRKSGDIQYVFVNNRCINNKTIYQAAVEGYRGFLHKDLKPTYFYFLQVDPAEVDVNIHPRKNEVRFNNNQLIFQAIYTITKKTLENSSKQALTQAINSENNQSDNLYKYESSLNRSTSDTLTSPNTFTPVQKIASYMPKVASDPNSTSYLQKSYSKPTVQDALSFTRMLIEKDSTTSSNSFTPENTEIVDTPLTNIQNLNPLQVFNTYIVFEKGEDVIFVDQHAAAEKINFERLYKSYGAIKTKPMLVPEIVSLKKFEKEELLSRKEELAKSGIIIDDFGSDTVQVLEIPEILEKLDVTNYIQEILNPSNEFSKTFNKDEYNNLTYEAYILIATQACHGSIRAGQKLSIEEMKKILLDLLSLKNPYNCPHGRPVMWQLERSEIEKSFKRKI